MALISETVYDADGIQTHFQVYPSANFDPTSTLFGVAYSDDGGTTWAVYDSSYYDLINATAVFNDDHIPTAGYKVAVRVGETIDDLGGDPSAVAIVAANIADVITCADNIDDIQGASDAAAAAIAAQVAAETAQTAAELAETGAAADLVLTNADVVLTNADVVLTNADVISTNADVVLTGLDVDSTNADVILTNADVVLTGLDVDATNADVIATNADVVSTNADVVSTASDAADTAADAILTAADVVACESAVQSLILSTKYSEQTTGAKTTFTPTNGYTVGLIEVFLNGILLDPSDYTATNGTDVVLDAATRSTAPFDLFNSKAEYPYVVAENTWLFLSDVDPNSYSGQAGKSLSVNLGEDGIEFTVAGAGDMLAANNLSEVNALIATQNLGVEIDVDVQGYDAVLAATTASFLTTDETKLDSIVFPGSAISENVTVFNGTSGSSVKDSELPVSLVKSGQFTCMVPGTGILTAGAGAGEINMSAAIVYIINPTTLAITKVTHAGLTNWTPTNIATWEVTRLYFGISGLEERETRITSKETRSLAGIGLLAHVDGVNITRISNTQQVWDSPNATLKDMTDTIGYIAKENIYYSPNGSNLYLNKSAGESFFRLGNIEDDIEDPNFLTTTASTQESFSYTWKDSSGDWHFSAPTISIIPGVYNDISVATDVVVGGTVESYEYSIIRIYHSPTTDNLTIVQYGQQVYSSFSLALVNVANEIFESNPTLSIAPLRCSLVVKGNATKLNDIEIAQFINTGKFNEREVVSSPLLPGVANIANIQNGIVLTDFDVIALSQDSGATVDVTLEKTGTGNLSVQFDAHEYVLDTTPKVELQLTPGSDTVPLMNYVYITHAGSVLTLETNTTGFPSTPHAKVAKIALQTATTTFNVGNKPFAIQKIQNSSEAEQGIIDIITSWIRSQFGSYASGLDLTLRDDSNNIIIAGGAETDSNVYVQISSGSIIQLRSKAVPAIDTTIAGGDDFYVVNDSTASYTTDNDLINILTDATGTTMSGSRYNLVLWHLASETGSSSSKLMINLPLGSYSNNDDAINDVNNYSVKTIPSQFKNQSILGKRITIRHTTPGGGNLEILSVEDLTDDIIGGGGGVGSSIFPDSSFTIQNAADNTKQIQFDASVITTGTIKTITMPDSDVALVANPLSTTDIGSSVQAYDADNALLDVVQVFSAAQRATKTTVTYAASVALNLALSNDYQITLTGNLTLANPTNIVAGQSGHIVLIQDGTGSRTISFGTYFKFAGGTAPTLTTTASAVDIFGYYVRSATEIDIFYGNGDQK